MLSLIPPLLHYRILDAPIDNVRVLGVLHPLEILWLRHAGRLSALPPLFILAALIFSALRSSLTRMAVAFCVLTFAGFTVLYLWAAIIVIFLHVAPPNI
jgi:hypothetical protein